MRKRESCSIRDKYYGEKTGDRSGKKKRPSLLQAIFTFGKYKTGNTRDWPKIK
jgi:hypothetical protein